MNIIYHILRKLYSRFFQNSLEYNYEIIDGIDEVNDLLFSMVSSGKPCMIARYGATELSCILNYISIKKGKKGNILNFIRSKSSFWWWNKNIMNQMQDWSGFFPSNEENLARFSELMIEDSQYVDALAVFNSVLTGVDSMQNYLTHCQSFFSLPYIDPFLSNSPWTRVLRTKKVLVVHPFAKLIEKQYLNRDKLFENPDVLPEFELRTVEAVQSLGGDCNQFEDWFAALEWMKKEIDKEEYDVCLLGCGAYGFPLAAHVKRTGHIAIHVGGSLQLWFGIKGKRWENQKSRDFKGISDDFYLKLMNNPFWVRPDEYVSSHTKKVENGCYW